MLIPVYVLFISNFIYSYLFQKEVLSLNFFVK